jgi:hypothetical protein
MLQGCAESVLHFDQFAFDSKYGKRRIEGRVEDQADGLSFNDYGLPNIQKLYVIHNQTTGGHNVLVETAAPGAIALVEPAEAILAGSPAVVIALTGAQLVYCDGNNNFYAIN